MVGGRGRKHWGFEKGGVDRTRVQNLLSSHHTWLTGWPLLHFLWQRKSIGAPCHFLPYRISTLQIPTDAKCHWPGGMRHLWNLTPHCTHRPFFFLLKLRFFTFHLSCLTQEEPQGYDRPSVLKISTSVISLSQNLNFTTRSFMVDALSITRFCT